MTMNKTMKSDRITWNSLTQWYSTPLGKALHAEEKRLLEDVLADLFGYHLLQVGRPCAGDLLEASRVSHCTVMDVMLESDLADLDSARFCGQPHVLPVTTASLDVVVLPHVLEFAAYPHEVLREVDRVLIPEGNLVLLGFNPWSPWMLNCVLMGWRGAVPWAGRFRSIGRIRDWLSLLGFEIDRVETYFFKPPINHSGLLGRLSMFEQMGKHLWPALGGAFLLVAKKKMETLTPIRPRWRPRRRLVATGLIGERRQGNINYHG